MAGAGINRTDQRHEVLASIRRVTRNVPHDAREIGLSQAHFRERLRQLSPHSPGVPLLGWLHD